MWLPIKMDVAAKFATQWTHFLIISKSCRESYVAANFQLNMTFLVQDKIFFCKNDIFWQFFKCYTIFDHARRGDGNLCNLCVYFLPSSVILFHLFALCCFLCLVQRCDMLMMTQHLCTSMSQSRNVKFYQIYLTLSCVLCRGLICVVVLPPC